MNPDLTTRRGIDAEIQRLTDGILDIKDDYRTDLEDIIEGEGRIESRNYRAEITAYRRKITELEEVKESIAKPWEKLRPAVEASLMRYGVTV